MKTRLTLVLMVLAYIAGSVPFSYLVARSQGVDLREVGSGNIGAGNVWRSCGFKPFLAAITLDILKGTLLPLLAIHRFKLPPVAVVLTGACAMLGHAFPVFMRFKGGKAVATGGGVLLAIFPLGTTLGAASWFIIAFLSRITSLASLTATAVVAVLALTAAARGRLEATYAGFICAAGAVVVFLHRANIRRLLAGKENRVQKLF